MVVLTISHSFLALKEVNCRKDNITLRWNLYRYHANTSTYWKVSNPNPIHQYPQITKISLFYKSSKPRYVTNNTSTDGEDGIIIHKAHRGPIQTNSASLSSKIFSLFELWLYTNHSALFCIGKTERLINLIFIKLIKFVYITKIK